MGYITTSSDIMSRTLGDLSTKIQLGWKVGRTCIRLSRMLGGGLMFLVYMPIMNYIKMEFYFIEELQKFL